MTEQVRLQKELSHQAFHDPLTGLANQALFRDRLSLASARLARHGGRLAVMFIDLDDFKTVNDSLGHSAGDDLLVTVSERITSCLRPGDTAARLGGDEFAVLIDELSGADAAVGVAERILGVLQAPVGLSSTQVTPAASIGIAYGTASTGVDELLRNADLAMYTAKGSGKNCFQVFADEMHQAAVDRLDLEARLRGAAGRGELVIHYQPIFELGSGRVVAMEALVRWAHPERGLLGPLSFIPFAEEGGLIDEIGHHVMVTAVEEAVCWARQVGAELAPAVSVNISPRQLVDPHLTDRVELLLHRSGLHPAQLILEITEGALMKDPHGRDGQPATAQPSGSPAGRGRLRHRLLVAGLPAAVPDRRVEDRRVVRARRAVGVRAGPSRRRSCRSRTHSVWSRSPRASRALRRSRRSGRSAATWPRGTTWDVPWTPPRRAASSRTPWRPPSAPRSCADPSGQVASGPVRPRRRRCTRRGTPRRHRWRRRARRRAPLRCRPRP